MRWGEECPYITPCGWCSRQGKPCEKRPQKPRVDAGAEVNESELVDVAAAVKEGLKSDRKCFV